MIAKVKKKKDPYIISLGVGRPPKAQCTCGWSTEPTEDLYVLGAEAFKHRDETGHQLRKPDDYQDIV